MSGHGIVKIKPGDTFEGSYQIVGEWVLFTGRLFTRTLQGTLYRGEVTRTWPREQILSIVDGGQR